MNALSSCFRKILDDTLPSIYQVSLNTCGTILSRIANLALSFFSPKQSMRPDTFSDTLSEVACQVRTNLAFQFRRVSALFREYIPSKAGLEHLNVLDVLAQPPSAESHAPEINEVLDKIFSHMAEDKNYLDNLDFFVATAQSGRLKKQHDSLKELFTICSSPFF